MSIDQIKQSVLEMSDEERFQLTAFLTHLREKDDLEHQHKLNEANSRISQRQRLTLDQLRQIIEKIDDKAA